MAVNDRHISPAEADPVGGTLLLGAGPTGERSGPPPRLAVEGRSSGHGPMLPISDVDYVKPMLLPHGGWPMAAGPVSRLDSFEPGDKTGLRLSPHLAPSTCTCMYMYVVRNTCSFRLLRAKEYICVLYMD